MVIFALIFSVGGTAALWEGFHHGRYSMYETAIGLIAIVIAVLLASYKKRAR